MKTEGRSEKREMLPRLSTLLVYPRPRPVRRADDEPEIAAFFDETEHVAPDGMEELYTTTFDLNPVSTLDVGWHLWGEQYERGRFLAELRGTQEAHGIDAGFELPDHLTVVLPTIARTGDAELIEKTRTAVEKMLVPLEEHGNPYRHLLRAVNQELSHGTPLPPHGGGEGARGAEEGEA